MTKEPLPQRSNATQTSEVDELRLRLANAERKLAEAATKIVQLSAPPASDNDSESAYRNLFINMAEAAHLWRLVRDESGHIRTWTLADANPSALRAWKREIEDVRGKTIDDLFGAGATTHYWPIVQRIMQTNTSYVCEDYCPLTGRFLRITSVPMGEFFISTRIDITEMREAEEAKRRSDESLRLAIEGSAGAEWEMIVDPSHPNSGDWIVGEAKVKALIGCAAEEPPHTLSEWLARIHPDDLPSVNASAAAHAEGRIPSHRVEYRIRHKDGSWRWIFSNSQIFRDGADKPVRWAGVNWDITERKNAEREVTEAHQRTERVLSSITDGYYALDDQWRFVKVNPLAERHFMHTAAELLGRNIWEIARRTAESSIYQRYHEAVQQQLEIHFEAPSDLRPGSWSELHVYPHRGGLEVYFRDITDRKHAEEELRESKERLSLAIEAAELGTWEFDLASGKLIGSPRCFEFLGVPHDTEISYVRFLAAIHPDDRSRIDEAVLAALEQHQDYNVEMRTVWPDESVHWIAARGRAFYDAAGRAAHMYGVAQDSTQRKLAEEALMRNEKLATVGRMASSIAHEINNPLGAVTNILYLLKTCEGMPEIARIYLDTAEAELERVAHITRQALGFYSSRTAPARTSVSDVLESVIALLKSKISAKHATIERQWKGDARIMALEGELRQLFSNLISNSLDAIADHGTVSLRISCGRTLRDGRPCATVIVADDGPGVSPRTLAHLFEPFHTTKWPFGNGLGLWVCKQIVDRHCGTIRVRSRTSGARRGTTVAVALPVNGPE
jgi:PAS domain S-box-containing protein